MNQHKFEGSLMNCLKCFRPANDPIHCLSESLATARDIKLYGPNNQVAPPICMGHTCPSCKKTWNHNYDCGKVDIHGLCIDCAQQTASDINRLKHIEEIGFQAKSLTPREVKELQLDHEQFVVLNITHIPGATAPDGKPLENPNWQADLAAHIKSIEVQIEKCKVKISGAHKARASQEVQDLNKISPEEREQFLRDAQRNRTPKPPKSLAVARDEPLRGTQREKAIMSMLKMLHKDDTPANRLYITKNMLGED